MISGCTYAMTSFDLLGNSQHKLVPHLPYKVGLLPNVYVFHSWLFEH